MRGRIAARETGQVPENLSANARHAHAGCIYPGMGALTRPFRTEFFEIVADFSQLQMGRFDDESAFRSYA